MRWPIEAWDKATECTVALKDETDPDKRARLVAERDGWIEVANRLTAVEHGAISGEKQTQQIGMLH